MIQLLQSLSDGATRLAETPVPRASGAALVAETRASVVSAGTERMLVEFGRASLLEKARRQPEKVRQVLDKVRTDGLAPTIEAVRAKLESPIPLGYCNAGVVVEVGPRVRGFARGDRVVTNGPHAEYVRVPHTLAARIPADVSFEAAAFTPLAAIGLQGLRLSQPTVGETVVVYGLGLIGLLTVQLARAAGCRVVGVDVDARRCAVASAWADQVVHAGAGGADGDEVARAVIAATGGDGADVVLLTLATESADPVHAAATMARKRGRLVLVGTAGLHLRRDDFYKKELSFQVSCSYGPGRYDPMHEEQGVDYPMPFVRWTEGRNFEAVLALMASGRLDPAPLISHRLPIAEAARAYDLGPGGESSLGVVLTYPPKAPAGEPERTVVLRPRAATAGRGQVGWIGAGNFASRVLIPAFAEAGARLDTIASAGGLSAAVVGSAAGFHRATTEPSSILADPAIDTVVITTRHDSHAEWTVRALEARKHVFVEKPLALSAAELACVEEAATAAGTVLCVGFNRRFAPTVRRAREALAARAGPLAITMLINAGQVPRDHWTQDREAGGGRIVGEACHFIDLARFLVGSPIEGLGVRTAREGGRPVGDVAVIELGFADGSLATVQYLSNGHRAFPKERIELFFDGRVVRIDNYRHMEAWGGPGLGIRWPRAQDKGHRGLAAAFLSAVRDGGAPPIGVDELVEVSRWSVRAGELAAGGGGRT